jgi:hypothetical protein
LKAAVDFAASISTPLVAHSIIHWVGTDAGDDPTGELFAQVREAFSLWLRRRGVSFAAVWTREKLSGGQAEVEHGHLLFHLPDAWLKGAKLLTVSREVTGGVELLQLEAALSRIVRGCAGRLEHYGVKLKIPTDGGNPGPYNGRSYDGLYLLKGGDKHLETLSAHQTGMAQASRRDLRQTLRLHSEPWPCRSSPCWLR